MMTEPFSKTSQPALLPTNLRPKQDADRYRGQRRCENGTGVMMNTALSCVCWRIAPTVSRRVPYSRGYWYYRGGEG